MRVRRVVAALIAGLAAGLALGAAGAATTGSFAATVAGALGVIGGLWVNAIRMTVVPLVVSLLFVGVAAGGEARVVKLTVISVATFIGLLICAAIVAGLIAPALVGAMPIAASTSESLRASVAGQSEATVEQVRALPGFGAWFAGLLPANPIRAAADGAMLPLILFTLLTALAVRHIEAAQRDAIVAFFRAIGDAMKTIVGWVIAVAPIGIFALVTASASRAGIALAGAMAYYVAAISALLLVFVAVLYPIVVAAGGISLRDFARGVFPAQAVALGSSSSLASLPALIEGSDVLALGPASSGFVLPFSVSVFKVAGPVTWGVGTLFLARLYGIPMSSGNVLALMVTSIGLGLVTPGVPQGAMLMLATIVTQFGIPPEGIALLIAADTIPDLVGTMCNVTGDLGAAVIVKRYARLATTPPVTHDPA